MGVFDQEAGIWNYYRCELQMRGHLNGGIPKDPAIIEGWLRSKAGLTTDTEELRQATLRTLIELGADVRPDMSYAEIVEASQKLASQKSTNGFKRNQDGLYLEARQIKAMLKEATNAYFAGDDGWGPTKKAAKSYVAERIFIAEEIVSLGRAEPDGVELSIGHVSGPQGKRATLTYYEFVDRAHLTFHVMEAQELRKNNSKPSLTRQQWAVIWTAAQELGLGARRSQEQGKFDVVSWEQVEKPEIHSSSSSSTLDKQLVAAIA